MQNSYPNYLIDLTSKKLKNMPKQKLRTNDDKNFSYQISIPSFGNPSHKFDSNLAKLIGRKFDISLAIHYKTVQTASYFH